MTDVDAILKRVTALSEISGLADATISTAIFKDGKRIAALRSGKRAWPETLKRAADELAILEKAHRRKAKRKVSA